MKIVNSLLVIIIFVLGLYSLEQGSIRVTQPAAFLPADTLLYIEQKNGLEALERFDNSRLGRILGSIDYPKVLSEADAELQHIEFVEKILDIAGKLRGNEVVHALLGKRITLALIGMRKWSPNSDNILDYLKSHLMLISKPGGDKETLQKLLVKYLSEKKVSLVPYGRYTITRIQIGDNDVIATAYVDGVVLAVLEERVLRESLDLYDKKKGTLKRNLDFINVIRELDGSDRFLYCSVRDLLKVADSLAGRMARETEVTALKELSSVKGVSGFAYGSTRQKKTVKNKVIVRLDQEAMDRRIQKMVSTAASMNDSLPYVARDALLYYWSNSLELQLLWEMYTERVGAESREVTGLQQAVRELSGYEIADLIKMIGSDISVIVHANENEFFVPIPDMALFVKLNDTPSAANAIQQVLKRLDLKLKNGTYKEIEYFSWGLDPNESLQPVYTIHRNYLIVANTLNMLKSIIDTPLNNTRLVASKGFRELDPGFQTLNNSVCYVDHARLLLRLQEFVGWAGTMLAIQDRQAAEKSKALIDNLIDPLFWGLSMYEKSAIRTYVRDGRIYIESQTRIIN